MTTDPTTKPVVHTIPGAADIVVERDLPYTTDPTPLTFDLYRPLDAAAPGPMVVCVTGLPDPGVVQVLGKPLKDWTSYIDWARLIAASGIAAITYRNRVPADIHALVRHLRANAGALGLDPARLGVWSASGNVPTALAVIAHERPACAALLYGYLLDLDGATTVAEASARYYFAVPPVSLDALPPDRPLLIVRAGRDATPGLDATLLAFIAAARARQLAVTLLDLPDAPHAFDLVDDSPATHIAIEDILAFLRRNLGAA
jgi:hypothetical protein